MKRLLALTLLLVPIVAGAQRARPAPEPLYNAKVDADMPAYAAGPAVAGSIKAICSETFPDLLTLWIDGFRKNHPGVTFDLAPTGGGVGSQALARGEIDLAAVTREINPADEDVFVKKYGYKPTEIAVVGGSYRSYGFTDALTVFVNKENPLEHLSLQQFDAIYSKTRRRGAGAITTWGQLGLTGDWASQPIHAWGVQPWNGFEQFVRLRALLGGDWREGLNYEKTVIPLPDRVAADRLAISYSGFAYIKPGAGVKSIALSENPNGPFLKGTFDEVAAQTYPLSRVLYFYFNRPPGKPIDPKIKEFLKYILSRDGQQAVVQDGIYTPLPTRLVKQSLQRLQE